MHGRSRMGAKHTADSERCASRGAQPAYIAVEDGSLRLGCVGAEPLSLVVDHAGIY